MPERIFSQGPTYAKMLRARALTKAVAIFLEICVFFSAIFLYALSGSAPSDTATLLTVFGTFTLVCAALISGIVYLVGRLAALNRTSAVYTLSDDGIRRDVGGRVDSLSFTEITEVRVWRNQGQRIRVMRIKGASLFSRWYVTDLEDMDAFAAALGERVPQSTIVSKRLYLDLGEPRNQVLFLAAIALAMAAYVIIRSRVG